MSLDDLQERFKDLQEETTQVCQLIDRVADLDFTPSELPLRADEEDSALAELSSEITQTLREGDDELEVIKEEVEDLPEGPAGATEDQRRRLVDEIWKFHRELAHYRTRFRQSQLAARKRLADAQRDERDAVLQSYSPPADDAASPTDDPPPAEPRSAPPGPRKNQAPAVSDEDQQVVAASTEATKGLHRLRDNIEKALLLSNATHETLEESSAALGNVGESYASLDSMLGSSKQLVATLVKSRKSDTWYLQTSLCVLLSTLAWLVFRRWLYGPLWWLVWLPIRLVFRTGVGVGNVVRPGEGVDEKGVDQARKASVEGLPDESLPTAQVEHEVRDGTEADPDSMAEKVGSVIDEARAEASSKPAEEKAGRAANDAEKIRSAADEAKAETDPTKERVGRIANDADGTEAENTPVAEEGRKVGSDGSRGEGAAVKDEL